MKLLLNLKHYDEAGRVKPSAMILWCLLFLIRSIIVFVISFTLQQGSAQLLTLFYPQKIYLYVSMVFALPALCAYLLVSFREVIAKHHLYWIFGLIKPLFLLSCLLDIAMHYYLAKVHFWQFSWPIALSIFGDLFIGFYLFKDRHLSLLVRDWAVDSAPNNSSLS